VKIANTEALKLPEYAAFDVLRFCLAAAVSLSHSGIISWENAGNLAVQVFFALSGWLIGGILYETRGSELCRFYFNRSTRVWIPYLFTVAAIYLVSFLHESRSDRWFEFLAYDLTFTHNWFTLWPDPQLALTQMPLHGTGNHFWSLAVEEQFYLAAPLIITLLPFGRKAWVWIVIAAAAYLSGTQYASISFGVLAAVLSRQYSHAGKYATFALLLAASSAAAAMAIPSPDIYLYAAPFFAICVVLLCARPVRRNAVTKWLGGVSFPLYLNAWMGTFVFNLVAKLAGIHLGPFTKAAEFAFVITAAAVTYSMVDRPVMKYRDKWYTPRLGWTLGMIGYCLVTAGFIYGIRRAYA
jgi:peptidoglycan/LPS O-acetylase OafA/YrhL